MNPFLFTGILILGVGATVNYFLGVKKNRWLGKRLSVQSEEVLAPTETNYVNIGGAIGYNFRYQLKGLWNEAKGTFTFVPRHSLLYMPVSFLIRGGDHYYLNIYTDKRLPGEGHIILASHLRKAKIDGLEAMSRKDIELGGRKFVLLWGGSRILDKLEKPRSAFRSRKPSCTSAVCRQQDFFFASFAKRRRYSKQPELFFKECTGFP
jgi:hypothetical protein